MTDIQINDEYHTTIDRFIKQLKKNWNISATQESRMRYRGKQIGTTQYSYSNGWDREKKEKTIVKKPFVVGDQWITGITVGEELMIRFDGGFCTGGIDEKRAGIIPRVYLKKKQ